MASSGWDLHFAHPPPRHFAVYPIGCDQVEDYAHRKDQSIAETKCWLAPYLAYDPTR